MSVKTKAQEFASRTAQLNAHLAEKLTAKGVEADGSETTTALIDKVDDIPQGGGGLDLFPYVRYVDFTDAIQEVKEDIILRLERSPSLDAMFYRAKTINAPKITVYIGDACTSMHQFVRGSTGEAEGLKTIEIIGSTRNVQSFNSAFYWRVSLEEIVCELDFSSATTVVAMFNYCSGLKKVRFKANTLSLSISFLQSPLLSTESIQSIVDGYKDMTGQTSPVLTLHPDVREKLTDTQIATLTSKNVTIA